MKKQYTLEMLAKPDACKGCPFYDDGQGFVPDELIADAEVAVLLQNPGAEEERRGKPAVGATGEDLNNIYLPMAGLTRGQDVSVCNALRCRWRHCTDKKTGKLVKCNHLPSGKVIAEAILHCRVHDAYPAGTKWIVASGGVAMQATGNDMKVTDWRGFPLPKKVSIGQ